MCVVTRLFCRADDTEEHKFISVSEVNLGDNLLESELLNIDTSLRAMHLQGQLDREGEGEGEGEEEEEELPPLLCGIVVHTTRPRITPQDKEVSPGSTIGTVDCLLIRISSIFGLIVL